MIKKIYDELGGINVNLIERAEFVMMVRKAMVDRLPDEHEWNGIMGALNSLADSLSWTAQEIEMIQKDVFEIELKQDQGGAPC